MQMDDNSPSLRGQAHNYIPLQSLNEEESETPKLLTSSNPQLPVPHCAAFLRANGTASAVVIAGMICCLGVTTYTYWLSKRILTCPDWAIQCPTSRFLKLNSNNIAIVQGMATITYSVGLAAMAYGAKCVTESAIWPLLSKQCFSIDQVDTYLSAARGSVPSTVMSWRMVSTRSTALVLILSAITTLTPLVAAPLVGIVFARGDVLMDFQSNYTVANGIGRIYVQTNPPLSTGDNSQSSYVAWALNQSPEPLPDYRLWVIDRSVLFVRGNMSVRAVKAETGITCQGTNVTEISSTTTTSIFSTRMFEHAGRKLNSSDRVQVQVGKAVAVWVHDFSFDNANKSSADLVFAAFNGSIENGINTTLSNGWTVSSIVCKVEIEFVDKDLDIGIHLPPTVTRPVLSLNANTSIPGKFRNTTGPQTLNENALWFAVAPLLVSMCVNGSQPLFTRWDPRSVHGLPAANTRAPFTNIIEDNYSWSTSNVIDFIEASVGAVAQASSRNMPTGHTTIVSRAPTKKLYEGRARYLIIPIAVIVFAQTTLFYWNARMHRSEKLPIMRLATVGEILKSAQTDFFAEFARKNYEPGEASRLGTEYVRYGPTKSMDLEVAGLGKDVSRFRDNAKDGTGSEL